MESIEVTIRFGQNGDVTPLKFTWREREYQVVSVGRNWQDATGWHILVMVPGNQVYELVFSASEMRWYIEDYRPDQTAA